MRIKHFITLIVATTFFFSAQVMADVRSQIDITAHQIGNNQASILAQEEETAKTEVDVKSIIDFDCGC
ncbi:MAG: hypothetical protein KAI83_02325 [Thiomargarita sp.]|nr:hypothetical protein [Thiomargarita sp.]